MELIHFIYASISQYIIELFDNHICRIKRRDTCRISNAPLWGEWRVWVV